MGLKTTYCGLLLLLVFAQWSVSAQQAPASSESTSISHLDSSLSAIYVTQSGAAFAANDQKAAADLVRIALEFDSSNSDAYYLQGELYEKMGGKIPDAIQSYRSALSAGNWKDYNETECRLKLAPLLIRTRQYAAAAGTLQGLGVADEKYYLEYAQALAGQGKYFQARNLLMEAAQAYPGNTAITVLRIRVDPKFRSALARRYLTSSFTSPIDKNVLSALIGNSTDRATKQALVTLYDKSFGSSPEVFAQSLMAASNVTPAEIDRYVSSGLLSNGTTTKELYAALSPGGAKSYLAGKIDSYTGTVTLDTNGDGIADETARYSSGKLVRLSVDMNQDGVPEYTISFAAGIPKTVSLTVGGAPYTLTYGSYPFVESASTGSGNNTTTYTLDPERISFPLFGNTPAVPATPASFPPVVSPHGRISRQLLFSFAVQIATTNKASGTPVSLWKKSISNILLMEKQWQSGRYAYKAVFHGGEKYSAEIDVDNDGYYEVHELYRNGKLFKITYDGDHDGIPGFTLVLEPYPILSWDFNDDGIPDEIEKRINPTTTILEFSTKMNGVFDIVKKEVKK